MDIEDIIASNPGCNLQSVSINSPLYQFLNLLLEHTSITQSHSRRDEAEHLFKTSHALGMCVAVLLTGIAGKSQSESLTGFNLWCEAVKAEILCITKDKP